MQHSISVKKQRLNARLTQRAFHLLSTAIPTVDQRHGCCLVQGCRRCRHTFYAFAGDVIDITRSTQRPNSVSSSLSASANEEDSTSSFSNISAVAIKHPVTASATSSVRSR